ncbi:hypothetical protein ECP030230812_5402 [Escherichia coli P0302308.12]|nr:hypothetical protein ECP030230812_5402 [Escherichia coli P0302308.12]
MRLNMQSSNERQPLGAWLDVSPRPQTDHETNRRCRLMNNHTAPPETGRQQGRYRDEN